MTNDLYRALQHCIVLARQGTPLEECLAQYPEYGEELAPLLLAATAGLPGRPNSGMPSAVRARLRQRVLAHWDRAHASKQRRSRAAPALSIPWAAAMVLAVSAAIILTAGAGVVMAAENSVPGTSLYQVKELREEAALWLTRSPEEKVAVYAQFVEERAEEIMRLAGEGESGPAAIAVARLEQHFSAVDQLTQEDIVRQGGSEPSASEAIIIKLENMLAEQAPVKTVIQETLRQSPGEAYPCLQHTLQLIQGAHSRVHSAVEALGQDLPPGSSGSGEGGLTLCPP